MRPRDREHRGVRVFAVAAEIEPGGVAFAGLWSGERRMLAQQRFEVLAAEQSPGILSGDQFVLAEKERMVPSEPFAL